MATGLVGRGHDQGLHARSMTAAFGTGVEDGDDGHFPLNFVGHGHHVRPCRARARVGANKSGIRVVKVPSAYQRDGDPIEWDGAQAVLHHDRPPPGVTDTSHSLHHRHHPQLSSSVIRAGKQACMRRAIVTTTAPRRIGDRPPPPLPPPPMACRLGGEATRAYAR